MRSVAVPWGQGTLGWRGALMLLLGFNEANSSKERDFTTVVGSVVGYLPLSSLVLGLSAAKYHQVPFPARIPTEPGQGVSALPYPTFHPPQEVCVDGESSWNRFQVMPTAFYPGSTKCDLPCNFCTAITHAKMLI